MRIYLDGAQLTEREPAKVFHDLAETPGVKIRIKRKNSDPMHLKSYQIDGKLLRTGAANFSASGLKRQDNDLIVIESAGAAASFKRNFDARFVTGEALPAGQGDLMTATLRPFAAFALLKTVCHDPHQSGSRWMALSLVAFLCADSNSCAVFAAATIEFIGEFNV
jgi:phosphatidylserine/phosphatidylglycerophosphate/cardiolipin synthase-like enzyme